MKILIAEDDFTLRTILEAVLKKQGHEVTTTVNGAEAWSAMQQPDAPKLAILDWMMPEMDGIEVCRHTRTIETDEPPHIIMLTSRDEKADIIAGLEAGANDYLAKPYDVGELQARVEVGRRMIEMQAALVKSREALAHQAAHDPLTSILNRRAILGGLANELSRAGRDGSMVGIGMCDLDCFKRINDQYGHQVGDEVLCGFTRIVQGGLQKDDLFGRYGGEEFLVITPEFTEDAFETVYERLRERVAESTVPTGAGDISVTVSIGVSGGTSADPIDALLNKADAALYRAKTRGRNCVSYADRRITEGCRGNPNL